MLALVGVRGYRVRCDMKVQVMKVALDDAVYIGQEAVNMRGTRRLVHSAR